MSQLRDNPLQKSAIAFIGAALVIAILYLGRELFIPLALALLFCFLLAGPVNFLTRRARIGRVLSVLVVVFACFSGVAAFGWMLTSQAALVMEQMPQYRDKFTGKITSAREFFQKRMEKASGAIEVLSEGVNGDEPAEDDARASDGEPDGDVLDDELEPESVEQVVEEPTGDVITGDDSSGDAKGERESEKPEPVKVEVVQPRQGLFHYLRPYIGWVVHPVLTIGMATILVVFFLVNISSLRDRIVRLCGFARIPVTTVALDDMYSRVLRFLVAQICANSLVGLVLAIGLYAIGIPNAALWGALTAVSRFFPYIGSLISTLIPFSVAVALYDGWTIPLLVVAWCVTLDLLAANVLEPLLYGARTGISPTAILVSFFFWTWLWGGFGLFLATPITVVLLVVGKNVPAFEWLYILLSDGPVLEPATRFYQRMLAQDADEAIRIADEYTAEFGSLAMFDQVAFQTLAQLENERRSGLLDEARLLFAREIVGRLVEQTSFEVPNTSQEQPDPEYEGPAEVGIVTDTGDFGPVLAKMLVRLGASRGVKVESLPPLTLASEVIGQIAAAPPELTIVAAIEPRAAGRLRYVVKRLHVHSPGLRYAVLGYAVSQRAQWTVTGLVRDCGLTASSTLSEIAEHFRLLAMRRRAERPEAAVVGIG